MPPLSLPAVLIAEALVAALACAVALASLCRYAYCGQLSTGGLGPGSGSGAGAGALTGLLATQPPEPAGTEGEFSRLCWKARCGGMLLGPLHLACCPGGLLTDGNGTLPLPPAVLCGEWLGLQDHMQPALSAVDVYHRA